MAFEEKEYGKIEIEKDHYRQPIELSLKDSKQKLSASKSWATIRKRRCTWVMSGNMRTQINWAAKVSKAVVNKANAS